MPVINDATVVNQAYQTSASARPQRLSNGWIVSAEYDSTGYIRFQVDKQNGQGFKDLCYVSGIISTISFTLSSKGTNVYLLATMTGPVMGFLGFDAVTVTNIDIVSKKINLDTGQSVLGGGSSLAINDAGTELHAAWASKNSTYPNSFNIRYAKGTIATDGSVVWGVAEQRTTWNESTRNAVEPTMTNDANGNLYLIYAYKYGTTANIIFCDKFANGSWTSSTVYSTSSFAQSSPSAIFVPQSINGLANGRIWVAWHGTDSTDTTYANIRVSYSDDGGATWSTMQKLTTGNTRGQFFPSITANKNNKIFIVFGGSTASGSYKDIKKLSNDAGVWSSASVVKPGVNTNDFPDYPSTLFDLAVNFTEPLFIYQNTGTSSPKVGFYGSWTTTTNSVPSGDVGAKSNPSNLLSYAITTDGAMSTITEKVNGATVGTKTATSGQALNVSLTDAQWDAVNFGKYHTATGTPNTLTIEMGTEKWTYTFTKTANENTTETQLAEALKDMNEVFLPAVKEKLAVPIRSKGGTVPANPSFDGLAEAIVGIVVGKKFASGTIAASGNVVTVTGLSFRPSTVALYMTTANNDTVTYRGIGIYKDTPILDRSSGSDTSGAYGISWHSNGTIQTTTATPMTSNGFTMVFTASQGVPIAWEAYE